MTKYFINRQTRGSTIALSFALAAMGSGLFAGSAQAEVTEAQSGEQAGVDEEASSGFGVIVVTARKREENL
ncbi:hypothetical protein MNBD_ALPHA04-262, partial [hydrothermal vent metagenome]